jgi:hypothetical protein
MTQIRKHFPHLALSQSGSLGIRGCIQRTCRSTGREPVALGETFEKRNKVSVDVGFREQDDHLVDGFGSL